MAITWIPNLDGDYRAQQREEEEDSDEEEGRSPWSASRRPMGGSAVIQIIRNGIRFVAPVSKNGESYRSIKRRAGVAESKSIFRF